MYFIYKKDIASFQISQYCCQVTRFFYYRAGSAFDVDAHFIGDDIGQGCFT